MLPEEEKVKGCWHKKFKNLCQ